METTEYKRQQNATAVREKHAAMIAEINAFVAELEERRISEFAALDIGTELDGYYTLLSRIARWHRIAAAVRCGLRPPKPIADVATDSEKELFARALGIIKSLQKINK